jgi:matrixin
MNRNGSRIATAFAVLLAGVTAASAFVLLSPPRRWFSTPRDVTVDSGGLASVNDGSRGVNAAVNAVNAWNGAGAGQIVRGAAGPVTYTLGDGRSDVIFSDPRNICKGSCIAATTTGYYDTGTTGTCGGLNVVAITDSDVAFNLGFNYTTTGENDGCSSEIYLEAVTTHEIGHLIGLAHSSATSALMYPSVAYCNNKGIASDDRSGAQTLYACTLQTGGGGTCDNDTVCEGNEDCTNCPADCAGRTNGKPAQRFCCGNGVPEAAETSALCDGNF